MGRRPGGISLKQSYGKVYSTDYVRVAITAALTLAGLIALGVVVLLVDDMAQAVKA